MGQRDNFSSKDVEKLNGMYCKGESYGESEVSDNAEPTTRPSYPLLNLFGNLVSAFAG